MEGSMWVYNRVKGIMEDQYLFLAGIKDHKKLILNVYSVSSIIDLHEYHEQNEPFIDTRHDGKMPEWGENVLQIAQDQLSNAVMSLKNQTPDSPELSVTLSDKNTEYRIVFKEIT